MSENNKFNQFDSDLYENDDFELEDFGSDNSEKNKSNETKVEDKSEFNKEGEINNEDIVEPTTTIESDNPFNMEDDMDFENDITEDTSKTNSNGLDKKKAFILGGLVFLILLIIGTLIFIFTGKEDKGTGMPPVEYITEEDEIIEDDFEVADDINTGTLDETKAMTGELVNESINNSSDIPVNDIEEILQSEENTDSIDNHQGSNNKINVNSNSNDEVINITEAILSPSSVKVKLNNLGEFDGTEENKDGDSSFIKVKESSLVIPTVSKTNFVPDVEIDVLNTQKQYSTSDLIKVEFNVLLNSKTLNYTVSKKIYKDKDFIIDISLSPINSDIVSIEENLVKEEVTIPINIMNKGPHTVWFKINNYPVESYTYNIK